MGACPVSWHFSLLGFRSVWQLFGLFGFSLLDLQGRFLGNQQCRLQVWASGFLLCPRWCRSPSRCRSACLFYSREVVVVVFKLPTLCWVFLTKRGEKLLLRTLQLKLQCQSLNCVKFLTLRAVAVLVTGITATGGAKWGNDRAIQGLAMDQSGVQAGESTARNMSCCCFWEYLNLETCYRKMRLKMQGGSVRV